MKRTLVASLLGLTMGNAAFGQGVIMFNNYVSTSYQQVMWAIDPADFGSMAGQPVTDPNVEVQLFWALGNVSGESLPSFYSIANAGVTTFINPGFTYKGGGYYAGPNQILTGWTSSQTVTFGVEAWETKGVFGGATFETAAAKGESALWTEVAGPNANANGIQPSSNPAKGFANGPPEVILGTVGPEPSTVSLAALGAAAFMLYRRKKFVRSAETIACAPKA